MEPGESLETALRRELREETGCTIAAVEPLGYVEENRAHADFIHLSCYYIVRTADDTLSPHMTPAEIANGTRVMWCTPLQTRLADFAEHCSWLAGPHVAAMLRENRFSGWETAFAAVRDDEIIGYCTFLQTDYYPDNRYWPWISSIFVDEAHRGQGVCGLLIDAAVDYAKALGFHTVYIPSDMLGCYERYGFEKIGELANYGGDVDNVFARHI